MSLEVAYFAWVRERVGKSNERLDPPADVKTVGDLVVWLAGQGENYAYAFENPGIIRAAVDRVHVGPETPIAGAREIALFPPMTGG
jgi:molybdopterin synthase sulfur carrier subunit